MPLKRSTLVALLLAMGAVPATPVIAQQSQAPKASSGETLRGIKPATSSRVILMPTTDKSGQGSSLSEFATEVINQSVRNGGITTVAWFKVEKEVKKLVNPANSFGMGGSSLTSDANMNEVIAAGKKLGARYVLRSVILKQSQNSQAETKFAPSFGMLFGLGGATSTQLKSDSEVDVKVDIISIREEDIIASKTFSGRSREVTKERANRLDGITGMQVFSSGSSMDSTKIAFYDTIDKIVDFLQSKTR